MKTAAERKAFSAALRAKRERATKARAWKRNGGLVGAALNAVFGLFILAN